MLRARLHDAVVACASFAGTVFLFEAALYAPGIRPGAASYLAVDAALTLAVVLALALAATALGGAAAPQAAVVALAALTLFDQGFALVDAAQALAVIVVLGVALFVDRELRARPTALALVSAAAICVAFRVWPRLCDVLAPLRPVRGGGPAAAAEVLVFAAGVAAALSYSAARRRRRRALPAEATVALSALALVTIVVSVMDADPSSGPSTLPARAEASAGARPSILVLLLDTVGADRLSIYGHSRPTSPELQAFLDGSQRAVLYPLAFSTAPWTGPAHGSLFTGRLPSEHGIGSARRVGSPRPRPPLLSQTLRDRGYRTAAVVANPMLSHVDGVLDGFDRVVRWPPVHPLRLTPGESLRALLMPAIGIRAIKPTPAAESVNRAVLDLVGQCAGGPCLVFANYMDAHAPYTPRAPYAGKWAEPSAPVEGAGAEDHRLELEAARHDEAIRGLDAALGELFRELSSSGVRDRWWIVVTSDHGEAFGEHGYVRHGKGLHVEQTKVPLLIEPPRGASVASREGAVSLIDVATTIAALGGSSGFGAGDDLRRPAADARPAQMESGGARGARAGRGREPVLPSRAVVVGRRQLIESGGRWELYDLGEDRAQRHDLAAAAPEEVDRLGALLPPGVAARGATHADDPLGPVEIDAASRRDLRALGYLD